MYKFCLLFTLILSLLTGCGTSSALAAETPPTTPVPSATTTDITTATEMSVHFLDVGQGLSVFVQSGEHNLIYDGGDRETSSQVVAYLKQHNVTDIDYLISSHYDADHLAGLIGCLNAFTVHHVIGSDYEHTSKLYASFINTANEQQLTVEHPAVGTQFAFGEGKFTILSPASIGNNSNANSVVIKLENGQNSFLLTGDADHTAEAVMCSANLALESDVLSISHHGSATATSYDFLAQVVPEYAVISCGQNNQYGHPDRDTMDKLAAMEIELYRNDLQGTIIALSDGQTITWNQDPCNDYSPGNAKDSGTQTQKSDESIDSTEIVWKSATGKKYHSRPDCNTMNPDNAVQLSQSDAEAAGLTACSRCF